ncbi:MAG: twin arginine-targeting protein translocase TatB [Helicobacteraceae bacterium 4484_230]|nr:MAG: twin arginine-targeting protein translocase TatB [Helicobacteraceae bacterium 4484_230]
MFGMGFAEILIIGIIAILFLGPDKLPQTMVEIAKFFRSVKRTVASAKNSIEEELHISELKEEAMSYKKELTSAGGELNRLTTLDKISDGFDDLKESVKVDIEEDADKPAKEPVQPEVVTFEKKQKKPSEKPKENDAKKEES